MQYAAKNKGQLDAACLSDIQAKLSYTNQKTPLQYLRGLSTWATIFNAETQTMNRKHLMHALSLRVGQLTQGTSAYIALEDIGHFARPWLVCHELYDETGRFIGGGVNHRGQNGQLLLSDWESIQEKVQTLYMLLYNIVGLVTIPSRGYAGSHHSRSRHALIV